MKIAIITGSAGLIGSQACDFFSNKGYKIIGIDNDMRAYFFGESSSTKDSLESLKSKINDYEHYNIDIRDYQKLNEVFSKYSSDIDIVIHTAAQPSHDWAVNEPLTDFGINATGTINMLEVTRLNCPKATFIFTSTNKVYGDRPNYNYDTGRIDEYNLLIKELDTRYEGINRITGELSSIDETMSIDNTKHSVFGSSKVAADVMCQEYGKYFGMNVGIFRGGCLTGPNHAGAELHGFLSYLVKCIVNNKPYTIFGYKGKQVRDNIHSWDLVNMFWHFHQNPKQGEVYNAGGGRDNSTSILEAINTINRINGTNWSNYTISEQNRIGDHIWYISDLRKFRTHYPDWNITINLEETIKQMVDFEKNKINVRYNIYINEW
jgi:CDP-paratose 2-epimerase